MGWLDGDGLRQPMNPSWEWGTCNMSPEAVATFGAYLDAQAERERNFCGPKLPPARDRYYTFVNVTHSLEEWRDGVTLYESPSAAELETISALHLHCGYAGEERTVIGEPRAYDSLRIVRAENRERTRGELLGARLYCDVAPKELEDLTRAGLRIVTRPIWYIDKED